MLERIRDQGRRAACAFSQGMNHLLRVQDLLASCHRPGRLHRRAGSCSTGARSLRVRTPQDDLVIETSSRSCAANSACQALTEGPAGAARRLVLHNAVGHRVRPVNRGRHPLCATQLTAMSLCKHVLCLPKESDLAHENTSTQHHRRFMFGLGCMIGYCSLEAGPADVNAETAPAGTTPFGTRGVCRSPACGGGSFARRPLPGNMIPRNSSCIRDSACEQDLALNWRSGPGLD